MVEGNKFKVMDEHCKKVRKSAANSSPKMAGINGRQ
jgi:hypothetical protein